MRKLIASFALAAVAVIGMPHPAHADTAVASVWQHPSEYIPMHNAAVKLNLSDSAFQKTSVHVISFIFGVAGITNSPITAPGGGNHSISTTYTPTELQALDHVAGVWHLSRSDSQKVSAAVVAFLVGLG